MPLIESITELNNIGKKRAEGAQILSDRAETFQNVLTERAEKESLSNVIPTSVSTQAVSPSMQAEPKQSEPTRFDRIFEAASQTTGVPVRILKAVAKQESGFSSTAVSKAGAMGVMQLMPSTAKSLGVRDPFDPEQNIMGGAKLLAANLKEYGGDLRLALAAYNAGSGAVKKYNGIPPYQETQNYVKSIMGNLGGEGKYVSRDNYTGPGVGMSKGRGGSDLSGISGYSIKTNEDGDIVLDKKMFLNLIEILRMQILMHTDMSVGDTEPQFMNI
ncbi:lytic transglycosylase domain-containing protein [Oribacterium sp. HCP28S3_H8]|uniref:lytic transglycosylase domain-containing protein n=1 Tax=Oribacterium sp. HCP28S3_H8 TaxID=3438945 RepID=UPI003F8BD76B